MRGRLGRLPLLWWAPLLACAAIALAAALPASATNDTWQNATLIDPSVENASVFVAPNASAWYRIPGAVPDVLVVSAQTDVNGSFRIWAPNAARVPTAVVAGLFVSPDWAPADFGTLAMPWSNSSDRWIELLSYANDPRDKNGTNFTLSAARVAPVMIDPDVNQTVRLLGYNYASTGTVFLLNSSRLGGPEGLWTLHWTITADNSSPHLAPVSSYMSCIGGPYCGRDDFPSGYKRCGWVGGQCWAYAPDAGSGLSGAGFSSSYSVADTGQGFHFFQFWASMDQGNFSQTVDVSIKFNATVAALPIENSDDTPANATLVTNHTARRGVLWSGLDTVDWFTFVAPGPSMVMRGTLNGSQYPVGSYSYPYLTLAVEVSVFNRSGGLRAVVQTDVEIPFPSPMVSCFGCRGGDFAFFLSLQNLVAGEPLDASIRIIVADYNGPWLSPWVNYINYSIVVDLPNHAPRLADGVSMNLTFSEDSGAALNLTSLFFDEDGDLPTYTVFIVDPGDVGLTFALTGPALNISAVPDDWGNATIGLLVVDGYPGGAASFVLNVTVLPVNDPPRELVPQVALRFDQGQSTTLENVSNFFLDVDGDALSYSLVLSSSLIVSSCGEGCFNVTVGPDTYGNFSGTLRAADPDGLSALVNVSIAIRHVNRAPVPMGTSAVTVVGGAPPIQVRPGDLCSDPDGDTLTLDYVGAQPTPDPFSFARATDGSGGIVLFVSDPETEGAWNVSFSCRDPSAASAEVVVLANVRLANYPPALLAATPAGPTVTIPENTSVMLRGWFSDAEGAELTYRWKLDGRYLPGISANATTLLFDYAAAGFHSVTLNASDIGGKSVEVTWIVGVTDVDRPPTCSIDPSGSLQGVVGSTITLAGAGKDPDGTPVEFAWLVNGSAAGSNIEVTVTFVAGETVVRLSVASGNLTANCSVKLVGPIPEPPEPNPQNSTNGTATNESSSKGFLPSLGAPSAVSAMVAALLLARVAGRKRRTNPKDPWA